MLSMTTRTDAGTATGTAPRRAARGAIMLLTVIVMSTLTLGLTAGLFALLLAGHQAIGQRLEREVAFRGAEAALLDAERDLSTAAAGSAASAAPGQRFGAWPAAGHCGTRAQRGLCSPAPGRPPPWRAWLDSVMPGTMPAEIGVPLGGVTGAMLPAIPADMAGSGAVPRYLIERLPAEQPDESGSSSASAPAPSSSATPTPPVRYRITALGQGRDPAARVVLQTEWVNPSPSEGSPHGPRGGVASSASPPLAHRRTGRLSWRELIPPYSP